MSLTAILLVALVQDPGLRIENPGSETRQELVRASVPLPRGRYRVLRYLRVGADVAPIVPLIRWPDGSLAVVQAHARVTVPAGSVARVPVVLPERDTAEPPEGLAEEPSARWHFEQGPGLTTVLEDPWGASFHATFAPDLTAGPEGYVMRSARVRVRRFRGRHRRGERQFFGVLGYLTTFVGERRAEWTMLLDNGAHAAPGDPVIGPARFQRFTVVTASGNHRILPRFITQNGLRPPLLLDGGWHQHLLGPSNQVYLGDRTAKAWRFDLFLDGPDVRAEERAAARRAAANPLRPIPDPAWTRHTGAFAAHGGPAPGPGVPTAVTAQALRAWRLQVQPGPFGSFGDPRDATANGTPRNGPCALHNVVRFASAGLLELAVGAALQHALRPTPGHPVRLPAAALPLRQGLTTRTMQLPHGFVPMDYEHFSADLLYDVYWLTGDPFCRDELGRLGRGLRAVLRDLPFFTCRGEGWCLQAAVLIARATGDEALLQRVHRRFTTEVLPVIEASAPHAVLPQPPHPQALDGKTRFDCPWQMAALVHGAHAFYRQLGDPRYAEVALRVARVMAGPGWLADKGPKYFTAADDPKIHSMALGQGPLTGTAVMHLGAYTLAASLATELGDQEMFARRRAALIAPYAKTEADAAQVAMNAWFQLHLDRTESGR